MVRWPMLLNPNQLSKIIQQQKNPLTALEIFHEAKTKFPNYQHNGAVYATMINILGDNGRFSEMKQLIEVMKSDSCECKDSTFAGILKIYAKAGMLNDAVSLYKSLPEFNCVNWTATLDTLLHMMLKESKLENFCRLLMEESNKWEIKSRLGSINMLMDALCRINRSDLASQIFQEMHYHCCFPNRASYKILMTGLCQAGRIGDATHLLYAMFWRISQKGSGKDIVIYRTLLNTLCEKGEVNEALEVLRKVFRKGLKAPKSRYKMIDLDQLRDTDIERAKILINEALVKGVVPNSASYTSVASTLYLEGKISEADKVLDEMIARGFVPSLRLYKAKVKALCRVGRVDEAGFVIEDEMIRNHCVPTSNVYSILIKGLCNQGKTDLAMGFFKKMEKQKGVKPYKEILSVIIDGLCREGRSVEASKIMETMLRRSCWPETETFSVLIRGLCSGGRTYEAVVWLEEMISQAKPPDASVWSVLLASVCYSESEFDRRAQVVDLLRKC